MESGIDFRIDGNGTTQFGRGDGFTFWYLANPPTGFVSGGGLGFLLTPQD
jgi:hypothetical protein